MKKLLFLFAALLVLAGCTPTGVPDPSPDHGGPGYVPPSYIELRFNVLNVANTKAERYVIGEAKAFDKQNKPMLGRDEKTGQEYPIVTPYKILTFDGEGVVQISYTPGAAWYIQISAHLQGNGGDSMLMEITNPANGNLMPWKDELPDICEVSGPPTRKGVCSLAADILVST